LGGVAFNALISVILGHAHSYAPVLVIAGLLHPISLVALLVLVRKIEPKGEPPASCGPNHRYSYAEP
ncbi:MAG: hypothetical protein ACRD44_02030, partial [Bryobacteraceae bacterium]